MSARPATFATAAHAPLTAILRGGIVESVHYGSVAVVDRDGRLLFAAGDPVSSRSRAARSSPCRRCRSSPAAGSSVSATRNRKRRSCARATPASRGTSKPRRPCSPRRATRSTTCSAARIRRFRSTRAASRRRRRRIRRSRTTARASTAACSPTAWPAATVATTTSRRRTRCRRRSGAAVAHMAGIPQAALVAGIDGCSAPNYAMPLARLALAFARLADPTTTPAYGNAPRRLADAMTACPEMVSGERRSDLALTRAGRGDFVCKIGAEGVQAIGVRSRGLGIAIKVGRRQRPGPASGDGRHPRPARAPRRRGAAPLDAVGVADASQLPRHGHRRSPRRRCLGQTRPSADGGVSRSRQMNLSPLQQSVTASVRCGVIPVAWPGWGMVPAGCRTCRSAGQQRMIQGLPADG